MLGILVFYCICAYLAIKLFIFLLQHAIKRHRLSNFPQPLSYFLIGDPRIMTHYPPHKYLMEVLHDLADKFVDKDKFFLCWVTTLPAFVVWNKNHVKEILSKNDDEYLDKGEFMYSGVRDFAPNGLFTVDGDKWRIRRKLLSQPFHPSNLGNFVKIVNFESKRMINNFKKNECKDLLLETKKISLLIYFKLLFEYDLSDEVDYVAEISGQMFDIFAKKALSIHYFSPFLYSFTSLCREENEMANKVMALKNKILEAKTNLKEDLEQKLKNQNQEINGKVKNLTVIEILLMNFKDRINKKISGWPGFERKEITAHMDTFIIAGVDTQSIALCNLIYDLAKYSDYQEKIYEEIQQVCFNNNDKNNDLEQEVTLDEIKQMKLLEAFVHESLRLKVVLPGVIRHIKKEIKLDDKYTLPANIDVGIFLEKLLKDPDYFPDPLTFKPERFLGDQRDSLYTNIPFSAGPRNCIAKKLALQAQSIMAANLLKHFKIEFAPSTPETLKTTFAIVNKPAGQIELKFVPRNLNK